jgi:hypothetical protein
MTLESWFDQDVLDPAKALIAKAEAIGDAELKKLAGLVAAQIPAAPAETPAVATIETTIQTGVDTALTTLLGPVPVVGVTLASETVTAANEALAWLEGVGAPIFDKLAAAFKSKLATFATS